MATTLVQTGTTIAIQSPYNASWAHVARMHGGSWNRTAKVWEFDAARYQIENIASLARHYYTDVQIADAFPVPPAPVALPDFGFVGTVGAVFTGELEITKTVDCNGQYGTSRLHIMRDNEGHVFTWFASTARYETGTRFRLQGKIKAHTPYKGVSQTVLTRCKKL
jgi:hypothetical protein